MSNRYQLMPSLSQEDLESLEASIKVNGVLVAVEYDEAGNIIDGHHRVAICEKLKIQNWPKTVRRGLTEEKKRALARQLNIARRHLSSNQKRMIIAQQLAEDPSMSDRSIAVSLGVDHKTVGSERARLSSLGLIPSSVDIVGLNGVAQPYSRRRALDPWKDLKLSFVPSIADVHWYELPAMIREIRRDLAILEALQNHCVPDNEQSIIRNVIPPSVASSVFDQYRASKGLDEVSS